MGAGSDLGAIVRARSENLIRTRPVTSGQRKAMRAIGACRTPSLGGHRDQCDRCGHEHIQWHSCRHRACPQCGGAAREAWLEQRKREVLEVPYFHVVFTVPEQLNPIALHQPRCFYDLLFRAVGQTLTEIARSRLGVDIGVLSVLHTWTQTLVLHPHVHCVVPGGGFSPDGTRWSSVRKPRFFLPVKVLSRRFRTILCSMLRQAWLSGQLHPGAIDDRAFEPLLASVRSREWVVYCKPPFAGPSHVLGYLANYTHRIAISNARILSFDGGRVTFRYRDSARQNSQQTMTLDADEFLRRFLLHVLPSRFVRIRYYGFLANRVRARKIALARALIVRSHSRSVSVPSTAIDPKPPSCPRCGTGVMKRVAIVSPQSIRPAYQDSS